ncbi:MAG TPA: hypothetical protein VN436_08355, partial [Holophaga sp.]|nr:hypothetical protein [Holophaga sp.]
RDVVFLGGGLSVPEVEANFTDSSGNAIPLGRQVLALDVYTGKVIAAVDMQDFSAVDSNGNPTMGPISKGLVPFEFIQNSGMAQRAYFLDAWGGLWSWGRQKTVSDTSSATYGYRTDTSDLALWTSDGAATSAAGMRLVAKDKFGNKISTGHYSEALYSTFPAPFRVSSFPGAAYTSGSPVPATVGVAMVSGDRNNPLDYDYTSTTLPTNHRLSVVFDRQDSALWSAATPIVLSSSSSAVLDAYPSFTSYSYGAQVLNPGSSTYYLAPSDASSTKFGYYRDFPTIDTSTELVSKGINTPTVVSGTLYYSYFTPTEADVCTGGSGYTYTWEICDVVNPIVADTRTSLSCYSGLKTTWVNIASDFAMLGTRGVIQSGTLSSTDSSGNTVLVLGTTTLTGQSKDQYPKPRVWRTVH